MFDKKPVLKIEEIIESRIITEPSRKYLGLSGIGHPCKRYIWYQFRLFLPPQELTPREHRLFRRGHREEPIIIDDLTKVAGVEFLTTQDECSTCSGHVKGHLDAILRRVPGLKKKVKVLGEFKTSKTKYFEELVKSESVKKAFFSHYCQMQAYMHLFKLKFALYICVNKEDDRRYYELVEYDKKFAEALIEKAHEIVLSEQPPLQAFPNSSYYRCGPKWCEYRNICWFNAHKKINRSCRSCKHSEIHDKGRWKCKLKRKFLSFEEQKAGCKKWELL